MAEAGDLKSLQCGFETRRGHQGWPVVLHGDRALIRMEVRLGVIRELPVTPNL
jgi:hypothetical protein